MPQLLNKSLHFNKAKIKAHINEITKRGKRLNSVIYFVYAFWLLHIVCRKAGAFQLFGVHIYCRNAPATICCKVVNAARCITAGGIDSAFVTAADGTRPARLADKVEDMKELRNAILLSVATYTVAACKRRAHKSGGRSKVAGQTVCAEPPAQSGKTEVRTEGVFGLFGGECHIVRKICKLAGKGRLVGEHANSVFVYLQPVAGTFNHNAPALICYNPVQTCRRHGGRELLMRDVNIFKLPLRLFYAFAPAENVGDELELGKICTACHARIVYCAEREIEACHTQPLFVDCIVIERISAADVGRAYKGQMPFEHTRRAEKERVSTRRYHNLLAVRAVVIQRATKIEIVCIQCNCCAHMYISRYANGGLHKRRAVCGCIYIICQCK